jgi:hypothetical protein
MGGLLGVISGALWRRLLRRKEDTSHNRTPEELLRDAIALEMLVLYVRSQYYNLHEVGKIQILRRKFEWAPFNESLFKLVDKPMGDKFRKQSVQNA